jgi:hypothetical protein
MWLAPFIYRSNQIYSIAFRASSVLNENGYFYLFKRNSYNGPTVNRNGVQVPTGILLDLPNRGFIESLNGFGTTSNPTPNYRWRVDVQDSPYSDKVGALYWSVDRTWPTNGTSSNETLYLRYLESSQALDLRTWSNTGASNLPNPDTNIRDTSTSNITYNPGYWPLASYVGPTLKYDKSDKPTGLYLKSTDYNSKIQQLVYNNFFSRENFFVANGAIGNAGGSDLNNYQLMLDYPMYTHCFNQFNRPVIFFNGFDRLPYSVNPSLVFTGSNYLKIFYKHTPQSTGEITNMFPLRVLTNNGNDQNSFYTYGTSYTYDVYYDDSTNKIFVAYLDNWVVDARFGFKRPDTLKVAILAFNSSTLKYDLESTERVVENPVPAGPDGLNSPKIFKDKNNSRITVTFSTQWLIYNTQNSRRFYVYQRTGNDSWTNIRGSQLIYMDNNGAFLRYR